jgi:hypothetical protein
MRRAAWAAVLCCGACDPTLREVQQEHQALFAEHGISIDNER